MQKRTRAVSRNSHQSPSLFFKFLFFNSKIWFFLLLNPRLFLPKPLIDAVRRRCLKNLSQAEEKVRKWTSATLPFDLEPNHWRWNSRKISIHKKLLLLVISLSQSSVKFMQGSNYLFTPSTSAHTHKHTLTHTCPLPRHTYLWTHTHTHTHSHRHPSTPSLSLTLSFFLSLNLNQIPFSRQNRKHTLKLKFDCYFRSNKKEKKLWSMTDFNSIFSPNFAKTPKNLSF